MQLGQILEEAAVPVVGREVTFHVIDTKDGVQRQARAEAVLHFVDEPMRHEADRHADEWLRNDPLYKKHGIVPETKRREEEYYTFLIRALRDKDDPTKPFCSIGDYPKFRKALVSRVVTYLLSQYQAYVADEYPELASPEQTEGLVEQALGK